MPGRRTTRGVGLSSALAACCFTTQDAGSFVLAPASMSMESAPVSRAQLLRAIPATVGAGVVGAAVLRPAISEAALPTAEDYAFGTGSKKQRATSTAPTTDSTDACPDCSLSERRKRAAASTEAAAVPSSPGQVTRPERQDELSAPLPKSSINPNNPVEVLRGVSGELDRMQALVNKERWGDALTRLRSFPLTTLKSPTLGMGSVGDVGRALGVTNSKASDILEASMEAGLTLKEVEDIVFSNTRTLEFFNSADYKQVEDLAKNRKPTDLTEPLQLLSDTKKIVDDVSELMGAGPASAR